MQKVSAHSARTLTVMVACLALSACLTDPNQNAPPPVFPEDVEYAPELEVDLSQMTRLESGIYIQTLVEGDGVFAQIGDVVVISFTGWVHDGTLFETVSEFTTQLEAPPLVPGLAGGIVNMREGEIRKIVVPSDLGFGGAGAPSVGVPPSAVLVFDVELVSVGVTG